MTDLQIESLLYSEIIISMADYRIDAWLDRETGEKTYRCDLQENGPGIRIHRKRDVH